MHKLAIVTVAGALTLGFSAPREMQFDSTHQLKEERIILEYTPSSNEVVVVMAAETEIGLHRVEVLGPNKKSALSLRDPSTRSISGFKVETMEAPLVQVLAAYPQGRYEMRASTHGGQGATGSALLVHELLDEPQLIYPYEGAVNVPTSGLVLSWKSDPEASGYKVSLEQGDSDGLAVQLPAGSTSLQVPDGLLLPGTDTLFEVAGIGPNNNCTIREVSFTTL